VAKSVAANLCRVEGCDRWNAVTSSAASSTFSTGSHKSCSLEKPFHCTRYCNFFHHPKNLKSMICYTSHCSLLTVSIGGSSGTVHLEIVFSRNSVNSMALKTGWIFKAIYGKVEVSSYDCWRFCFVRYAPQCGVLRFWKPSALWQGYGLLLCNPVTCGWTF
jgi:hypothetical protein